MPDRPSRASLSLLTDLYQLTMAYGYWKRGRRDEEAVFCLSFRENPFEGGYAVCAGLAAVAAFLDGFGFEEQDLQYLGTLEGNDGRPLFDSEFLSYLHGLRLTCDVDVIPEGTLMFPNEPIVRVRGPLLQAQILESAVLNLVNFPTLIATKATRICRAAQGQPVLEFGLRRAQGIDGAITASRAAYLGGCAATSNVLAGRIHGIPVKGTHAHSWVMSYDNELEAFDEYAEAMPNNCVFLVDTYDTIEGVRNVIEIGKRLRKRGHEMVGIRLDSGDLAWLSREARRMLDSAGLPNASIVASNDLDERIIASLKSQGAEISIWGVGTRLVTAFDQPALGGVYKLSAIRRPGRPGWQYCVKLSEQMIKVSNPGVLQVRRYSTDSGFACDVIYDEERPLDESPLIVDPRDPTRRRRPPLGSVGEDLLRPVLRGGKAVGPIDDLETARARCADQLDQFYEGCLRLEHPHEYPVGLEASLHELKTRLTLEARHLK